MFKKLIFILTFLSCCFFWGTAGSEETDAALAPQQTPSGMVLIPSGEFTRGTDSKKANQVCLKNNDHCKEKWFKDEVPLHPVKLDNYYLDIHEVTQKDYLRAMAKNPSEFKGSNLPVEKVTWYEAEEYCQKVGKRLPTEVEWEWAARGGKQTTFAWGNEAESHRANFCDKSCDKRWKEKQFEDGYGYTAPVGSFPANDFGLYDMAGNVYEWVMDWYDEDYYEKSPNENPQGPIKGNRKVIRGGSWINYSVGVRPSDRTDAKPSDKINFVGFRCAR
ncbi:MAG: formylglycine-generating enzyme family protein [Nitrospina sp.]|jgi:formylglycine-generating enzyme required for sulfatase activity|nr:formylglycine-generating enzyme family protein [Nitrospina sp.]MBT6717488.1 formylglycine-generating enzyme family protein [Nitrospina sp.]